MSNYQHILLATDFSAHSEEVSNKARELAERFQAKLSIVNVVENIITADMAFEPAIAYDFDLTTELLNSAKARVAQLAETLGIPKENQWVEVGSPKLEIVRIAEENQVDLIVIGSHGRHGLALLLGSTANSVLHHATCDVLAVRLQDDDD